MKTLSIIIPVFNEEHTIEEILRRVFSVSLPNFSKQVIAINDGSTDSTKDTLKNIQSKYEFVLINHKENKGKGAAIKSGLQKVQGDFVLIQDADLEYDPEDYIKLLDKVSKSDVDVVYGSRNLDTSLSKRGYLFYYLGGRVLTLLTNLIVGTNLTDVNTCYKLFPTHILYEIGVESNGFEFCEEVTVKTHMLGYSIGEVVINYTPRKFSEGKKIRFKDGLKSLWTILKFRIKSGSD